MSSHADPGTQIKLAAFCPTRTFITMRTKCWRERCFCKVKQSKFASRIVDLDLLLDVHRFGAAPETRRAGCAPRARTRLRGWTASAARRAIAARLRWGGTLPGCSARRGATDALLVSLPYGRHHRSRLHACQRARGAGCRRRPTPPAPPARPPGASLVHQLHHRGGPIRAGPARVDIHAATSGCRRPPVVYIKEGGTRRVSMVYITAPSPSSTYGSRCRWKDR